MFVSRRQFVVIATIAMLALTGIWAVKSSQNNAALLSTPPAKVTSNGNEKKTTDVSVDAAMLDSEEIFSFIFCHLKRLLS